MADAPLVFGSQRLSTVGTSGSTGTSVTSGTTNTKGSYTQITASTAFACDGLIVQLANDAADQADFLVDIAIGAAASEVVVAANLICGSTAETPTSSYYLPIAIPAGTRIAARHQSSAATKVVRVSVMLFSRGATGPALLQKCVTLGATTATTRGTSIDPGGSANTKGSYVQLISATVERYQAIAVGIGNQAQQTRETATWLLDIAIGAAASEKVIVPDLQLSSAVNRSITPATFFVPVEIPSGVRVSARCASTSNTATKRLFDVVVYGIAG